MEETVQQNIPYQPPQDNYAYIKPKTPLLIKLLYFLLGMSPAIAIFIFFIFLLNYFNFINLSQNFPFLPHIYDKTTTEKTLSIITLSSNPSKIYTLKGKLVAISDNRIIINYQGQIAEFLYGNSLQCGYTNNISADNSKHLTLENPTFCSEVLKSQNLNKTADILFQKNPQGYYLLNSLYINN